MSNSQKDPLYALFEHHLYNALTEDEGTEEFLDRVVQDFVLKITENGMIPVSVRVSVETDLRNEVLEMLRKKTYGHFNLTEFRKARATTEMQNGPPSPSAPKRAPVRPASHRKTTGRTQRRRAS